MTIQIERGVPIPNPQVGARRVYPWSEMTIGDSFFVPNRPGENDKRTCARMVGQKQMPELKYRAKYTVRKVEGGARVWRVA